MASGKKGKKIKGKPIALSDFLQETPGSVPTQPIRKSNTTSWADEVDAYDAFDSKVVNMVLPTAPKASRDYEEIASQVPKDAPFMAHLSNLPFDVDESEIADLFRNLKIVSMKIPRDDRSGSDGPPKLRGFGFVEFEDREDLITALYMVDTTVKNRPIRIEIAPKNDKNDWNRGGSRKGQDRGGFNRDRDGSREGGWARDGAFSRENRDFNRDRDIGFTRGGNRDFGERNYRDGNDRSSSDRGFTRGGNSTSSNDWERSSNNRDSRDERRSGFKRYDDSDRNGGFGFTRTARPERRDDSESDTTSSEPRQRQRLVLAPRSKPLDESVVKAEPAVPSSSIFGAAKPVDTAERERQIEEKLRKAQEDRLRESSRDRDKDSRDDKNVIERAWAPSRREDSHDSRDDKNEIERGRAPARREDESRDEPKEDNEADSSRECGPPTSRDRRTSSREDNSNARGADHRSPESRRKDKPKQQQREEKRDRPEMPKVHEPEVPNFQASNKFALLDDASD